MDHQTQTQNHKDTLTQHIKEMNVDRVCEDITRRMTMLHKPVSKEHDADMRKHVQDMFHLLHEHGQVTTMIRYGDFPLYKIELQLDPSRTVVDKVVLWVVSTLIGEEP